MPEITLTVEAQPQITLTIEQGEAPPTQKKSVTPDYQPQTVLPDEGFLLSEVEVDAIPELTDELSVTENGDYDVKLYGTAHVDVPQGVFPEGTLDITADGTYDVTDYAAVNVKTAPEKGVSFADFDADGYPHTVSTYGLSSIPQWYFWQWGASNYNRTLVTSRLTKVILNDGITVINESALRAMNRVTEIHFPSTLTRIRNHTFFEDSALTLLDFSRCTAIPTLDSLGNTTIPSGCVIRVPQSLLAEWQAAAGWADLSSVTWEGV